MDLKRNGRWLRGEGETSEKTGDERGIMDKGGRGGKGGGVHRA